MKISVRLKCRLLSFNIPKSKLAKSKEVKKKWKWWDGLRLVWGSKRLFNKQTWLEVEFKNVYDKT